MTASTCNVDAMTVQILNLRGSSSVQQIQKSVREC